MLGNDMGTTVLDTLLLDAEADLRSLVVIDKEPVTWLLIEAPGAAEQADLDPARRSSRWTGRWPRPATRRPWRGSRTPPPPIGTWLTLAAWTDSAVRGAAVSGYCHRAELVGATLAELPDLSSRAQGPASCG